ncbi:hypothetical protein H5410_039421 [Solanum commersonii]|uniref:ACT domain-containing protein ACR n=1 Tax=Solanum commersonii TaxID=4109 RepID=A0A9J5XKU7_SOLCO|nr:hypothetical protein H5410_039421 [Solanum commersonii]
MKLNTDDMEWPTFLDEYEKLVFRMTIPRVMIDNTSCSNATLVKIDSARKHGILLEAVQVLTDLNLSIKKAYVSCDGRWFMDVFHVTDLDGNKLTDKRFISYIEQSLGTIHYASSKSYNGLTALELTGTDRIGLLSEVFAVLSDLHCNVVEAKMWTHNGRIASLIHIKESQSGYPIEDSQKIDRIEARLKSVLKGDNDVRGAKTSVSLAVTHTERRLHQMMFADRDYERKPVIRTSNDTPIVSVLNCLEKGYSVVNIQCKDRTKLLFDVVCTLTDMQHTDGIPISSDAEKQRVILCLQSAIERRASEGVTLELSTGDKQGLLADVTRTFRENGLNVTRAEISTTGDSALNIFYITDVRGNPVDSNIIESVRGEIGWSNLKVKELPLINHQTVDRDESVLLSLGNIFRRNLYSLGLIKSFS